MTTTTGNREAIGPVTGAGTLDTKRSSTRPPTWARRAAVLAALTPVPSAVWRCSMALGLPLGVDPDYRQQYYRFPSRGTVHVLWISVLLIGLGLLTLGLVQRWGEVVPGWIPLLGGKRVPRLAAIIPASAGAIALTLLWLGEFSVVGQIFDEFGLHGAARAVVFACYVPMLLWGPLLGAVTFSYARRTSLRRQSNGR